MTMKIPVPLVQFFPHSVYLNTEGKINFLFKWLKCVLSCKWNALVHHSQIASKINCPLIHHSERPQQGIHLNLFFHTFLNWNCCRPCLKEINRTSTSSKEAWLAVMCSVRLLSVMHTFSVTRWACCHGLPVLQTSLIWLKNCKYSVSKEWTFSGKTTSGDCKLPQVARGSLLFETLNF